LPSPWRNADFLIESSAMLADFLRDAEDPLPKPFGVFDAMPNPVAGHEHAVRWSYPVRLFDEHEVNA